MELAHKLIAEFHGTQEPTLTRERPLRVPE
jgi:hypothetical protein